MEIIETCKSNIFDDEIIMNGKAVAPKKVEIQSEQIPSKSSVSTKTQTPSKSQISTKP
jgi:hypothetical protein